MAPAHGVMSPRRTRIAGVHWNAISAACGGANPTCWRVQHALDEAGVPYEIVKETPLLRSRRTAVIAGTGQGKLPAIQLEDGSWYRKESSEMAEEILAGALSNPSPGRY